MSIKLDSELAQGSPEWLASRRKGIGSSDIATIMNLNPYKSCSALWLEKTGQLEPEDISEKYHVKRGTLLEPLARNIFNEQTNSNFQPATFTHPEWDFIRYSSDGYEFDKKEIIEIKCLGQRNHEKVISENKVLDYYYPQLQWGMMVAEVETCHFIAYNPSYPEPIFTIPYKKDQAYFDQMLTYAHEFWHCVESKIMPDW